MTTIIDSATLDESPIRIDGASFTLDESTIDDTPVALLQSTIVAGASAGGGGGRGTGYEPSE